jgi:hypothetical protein
VTRGYKDFERERVQREMESLREFESSRVREREFVRAKETQHAQKRMYPRRGSTEANKNTTMLRRCGDSTTNVQTYRAQRKSSLEEMSREMQTLRMRREQVEEERERERRERQIDEKVQDADEQTER